MRRARFPRTATLLVSIGIAVLMLLPGLTGGAGSVVGNTGDPSIFVWSLAWVPFALGHHLNPLITDYMNFPGGVNLMWNASVLFPALILSPVTLLFGPIAAYNVMAVLGMGLSGWCAILAVGRYTEHWASATVAGLMYELSPFMASQITGHAQMYIAVFPPLLLLLGDEILVRRRWKPWLAGAALGVAAACQLLTGSELLTICAVMCIPVVIALAVVFRAHLGERRRPIAVALVGAAIVFVGLSAYPLIVQFLGPQRVSGVLHGFGFVARPTSFLIPSHSQLISGPTTVLDSSVYIGVPMSVLALAVTVRLWKRDAVKIAAVTLGCAMVLAMGGHLTIHGGPSGIPLPWDLAQHLPLLDNVLPVRFMVVGYLALAIILGLLVDAALRSPIRLRVAGLAAAAVALIPLIPSVPVSAGRYAIPAFFRGASAQALPSGGSVLITPYNAYLPQVWQAVAGVRFRTEGSVAYVSGAGGFRWGPVMDALGTELHRLADLAQPAPEALPAPQREAFLAGLQERDVTAVVVGPSPGAAQVVRFMTELLGRPGTATGGVTVWSGVAAGAT